jgi:hypothetical protein
MRWKAPSLLDALIVDLGSSEWTCVLMEKGELKKSHSLGSGTEGLLAALWEDRKKILLPKDVEGTAKQIDLQQIKPNLNPCLNAKLCEFRQEIAKVIYSFYRISHQMPIVFTGHIDAFGHLKEFLQESFTDAVSEEYNKGLNLEEQKYAIPIGLAIEQMNSPLQLLQQEFFPKKNWRRAGLYAWILLILSLSLSGLFLTMGLQMLEGRKKKIIESVHSMLKIWNPQPSYLPPKDEKTALAQWITAVETHHKDYPYILQSPRLTAVLSWLSNHPLLLEFKTANDPFDLRNLHYRLVEYPKIDSPQTRYRAKVEIQFQVKSPMQARKFHEALLQGDEIVDSSGEVSWEVSQDGYRASFFLRNCKESLPYVP